MAVEVAIGAFGDAEGPVDVEGVWLFHNPFGSSEVENRGAGVWTLACPERLPWQAVEGFDTNGRY